MTIKQILLVLSASSPAEAASSLAASIAERCGARVEAVCLFHEPEASVADSFAIGREGVGDVLDHLEADIQALTGPARASFDRAIGDRGLSDGWALGDVDTWQNAVSAPSRLVDLIVIAGGKSDRNFQAMTASLVLQAGVPCLVAPASPTATPFHKVALAWNGSRESARALHDGLDLLRAAASVVVVVAAEESTRWVDTVQTDGLIRHLARHGVQAELVHTPVGYGGAGVAILTACEAQGVDLLIAGAYGHSRAAETILGGATQSFLSRATLPVLLSH
ncbi:MAG TPA: universal stress protein [Caulobacteraceae bacterium]|nr:universal stress protein [Caulobacteraceae bacterium]